MAETLSSRLAPLELPDLDGNVVRLGGFWAQQPAVVVFLRHWGWIFCREHVAQLRAHESEFKVRGARAVAIGLGGMEYARSFRQDTGIGFPLLVDGELKTYHRLGLKKGNILHLLRGDNFSARKRAKAAGHRQHRLGKDPFQLGGTFVFLPGNVDAFSHISETFSDNAPMERVIAALPRASNDTDK